MIGRLRDKDMSIGVRKFGRRFTASGTRSNDGHPEYQEDTKCYELVEEVDRELLYGPGGKPKAGGEDTTKTGGDFRLA